jgi:hypothetical protein
MNDDGDDDGGLWEPSPEDKKAYLDLIAALNIEPPPKPNGRAGDGFFRHPESGKVLARHDNIVTALDKLAVKLRYNEFSGRIELAGLSGYGPELDDPAAIRIRFKIGEKFGLNATCKLVEDSLTDIAHANRYHPVRDYLASLQWDGRLRLDAWLVSYGGAQDTPFNRAVGALMLIAAVRRVRQPGCKFDTMPVFESTEGKNKSQALRIMAVRDEWFSDSMELGVSPREAIEATSGKWIVEIGELHGLSTREEGRIKAFLSRQEDHARAAYGHFPKTVGRQCVYVGTTNEDDYLKAEGRRILPVALARCDLGALRRDRDQLWAEAASREAAGESIVLAEDLWAAAAEVRADRVQENPFYSRLVERVSGTGCISSKTVWEYLGTADGEKDKVSKRVGQAMRLLGFERRQCGTDGVPLTGLKRGERYYERLPAGVTGSTP